MQLKLPRPPSNSHIIGEKINKFRILSLYGQDAHGHYLYECQCDCGNIILREAHCIKKQISCQKCKTVFLTEHIIMYWWNRFQRQANRRGIEFTITPEYLENLWVKQEKKCYLSGEPLVLCDNHKGHSLGLNTASVDRIDSSKGYIEGNVAWCHRDINTMKLSLSKEDFIEICSRISYNVESKQTGLLPD